MKTTSSKLKRGAIILAALLVPAASWWFSWRYYNASKQAESSVAAKQDTKKLDAEQIQKLEELKKKYVDVSQQNEELKKWVAEKKQKRDPLLRQGLPPDSIEFAKKPMRTSWNGQTDPDRVWHEQRQQARETLIKFDLPALGK